MEALAGQLVEKALADAIPNAVAVYNYFTSGRKAQPPVFEDQQTPAPEVVRRSSE